MKIIADGSRVIGTVYNQAVTGKVLSSRFHGKTLLYEVLLDNPIHFRWRDNPAFTVLLSNKELKYAPIG